MANVTESKWLEKVLFMREHGVARLRDSDGEIELFASVAPVPADQSGPPEVASVPVTCNCPHDDSQHDPVTGMCIEGCLPEVCAFKRSGA